MAIIFTSILLVLFSLTMLGSVIVVFVKHREFGLGGFTLTSFSISILIGMSLFVPSVRDSVQKSFLSFFLILGLVLSLLMVGSAILTFVKEREFGWGGFTLTFFGTLLLIFLAAVWGIDSQNTQTNLNLKSYARELVGASEADLNGKITQLERRLNTTNPSGDKRNLEADFKKNSEYSILIFYATGGENDADEIEKTLLALGYRASSTLSESLDKSEELRPGTVQILYTNRGKEKLEDIRGIMQNLPDIGKALNVHSETSFFSQGDLRIRIFRNELR
jgi:hypothetical protein